MADEEETKATADALESQQWAEDPDRSPSGEDEYFQGSGLRDNFARAVHRKKNQSRSTIRQSVADIPASTSASMLVVAVPITKVLASDMSTLALKLGQPNPLEAAPEVIKSTVDPKQQRDSTTAQEGRGILVELPTTTRGRKSELPTPGSIPARGPVMVAIHISNESDFAVDIHQFIPTAPTYSLPCQPSKSGDMEMRYDGGGHNHQLQRDVLLRIWPVVAPLHQL